MQNFSRVHAAFRRRRQPLRRHVLERVGQSAQIAKGRFNVLAERLKPKEKDVKTPCASN